MKKTRLFGFVALMLVGLSFASCTKEKEMSKTIPANRVVLMGDDYLFKVVDTVKVILVPSGDKNKWEIRTIIPVQNTKTWSDVQKQADKQIDELTVNVSPIYVDKNDTELDFITKYIGHDFSRLLQSEELTTQNVVCQDDSWSSQKNYKRQKEVFGRIDGVIIKGIQLRYKTYDSPSTSSSSSSYKKNSSKSSSQNWDKVLDEYEKYVDEYIKFYKKAKNGDLSALSKYADLLDKAEDLEDALEEADDNDALTAAQLRRYERIFDKLTNILDD